MAPKCKSSDAGNSDMPKRSQKVFPLSEKVKVYHRHTCVGENMVYRESGTTQFQASPGGLKQCPQWVRGDD
jgi:hypothetical protein